MSTTSSAHLCRRWKDTTVIHLHCPFCPWGKSERKVEVSSPLPKAAFKWEWMWEGQETDAFQPQDGFQGTQIMKIKQCLCCREWCGPCRERGTTQQGESNAKGTVKTESSSRAHEGDGMLVEYSNNKTEIIAVIFKHESRALHGTWDSSEAVWSQTPFLLTLSLLHKTDTSNSGL